MRAALDDDDINHDHEQHDDLDHSRPELPVHVPDILRLGGWGVYPHHVRGWRTYALDPVHDDDEQHDHDDAIVRLRDDDHEHDDGPARMHGRVYMGRRAASECVGHVGLGEKNRPLRPWLPVPTADDERLLQLRLDAMRDNHDDHDAVADMLRVVYVLVGSRAGEVDFSQLKLQPELFSVSMHSAIRAGRSLPGDHGSLRGARDADDDHHDHGRSVLAVLHHDDDERHDDDGSAVRVRILCVGMAAVAGAVVATCLDVPVELPM